MPSWAIRSPLVVGRGNGEVFIASSASALVGYINQVIYLQDGETGVYSREGMRLFDIESNGIDAAVEKLGLDLRSIKKASTISF